MASSERLPPFPPPPGSDPAHTLVLYRNPDDDDDVLEVPANLNVHLRSYQRRGVKFLFERCYGENERGHQGAILADDMGLGKTVQV